MEKILIHKTKTLSCFLPIKQATKPIKFDNREKITLWKRLIVFSKNQQHNRFVWLAIAITMQGCIAVPLGIFCIVNNGNIFWLWMPVISTFCITEVVNLAAMPTKITIPVFFSGIVIDAIVIILSFLI